MLTLTNVRVNISCSFRQQQMAIVSFTSLPEKMHLMWSTLPPVAVTPSSALVAVACPTLVLSIVNQQSAVMTRESSSTCTLSLDSAVDVSGRSLPSSSAYIDGQAANTSNAGVAVFNDWSLVAPPASNVTLLVSCQRAEGGEPLELVSPLVRVDTLGVRWRNASSILPSSAAHPVFLLSATYAVFGEVYWGRATSTSSSAFAAEVAYSVGAHPSAFCTLALLYESGSAFSGGALAGNLQAYNDIPVAHDASVPLSVALTGDVGVDIPLTLTCKCNGFSRRSAPLNASIARMRAAWAVPPADAFIFNSPMPSFTASMWAWVNGTSTWAPSTALWLPLSGANSSVADVSCRLSQTDANTGDVVLATGGAVASYAPVTGTVSIAPLSLIPAVDEVTPAVNVTFALDCTYMQSLAFPSLTRAVRMRSLHLSWTVAPPLALMPSSAAQAFLLPSISVGLYDDSNTLLANDGTTTCTLAALPGVDMEGQASSAQQVSLTAGSATMNAGVATFPTWSLAAPPGSNVTLEVSCSRAEGGLPIILATPAAMMYTRMRWLHVDTLDARRPQFAPLGMFDMPTRFVVSTVIMRPTTTLSTAPAAVELAYDAATAPAFTCTLVLDPATSAPSALLAGDTSLYQTVPANATGEVALTAQLQADAGSIVGVGLSCVFADATVVDVPASVPVTIAVMTALLRSPPSDKFVYNSPTAVVPIDVQLIAPADASENISLLLLPLPSSVVVDDDASCALDVSSTATGVTAPVTYDGGAISSYLQSNSSLELGSMLLQPAYV
ncbi:MAG: hypothetical protein EOO65_02440, partial [Methanosarcinales archaeon]